MASVNMELQVKIDTTNFDEIVFMRCMNDACVNNLIHNNRKFTTQCSKKYIQINKDGKCDNFILRE